MTPEAAQSLFIGILLGNLAFTAWENYRLRQQNERQRKSIEHNILALTHQQKTLADKLTSLDHYDLGPLLSLILDAESDIPIPSIGYRGSNSIAGPSTTHFAGACGTYVPAPGQAGPGPSVFPQNTAAHRDILKILGCS